MRVPERGRHRERRCGAQSTRPRKLRRLTRALSARLRQDASLSSLATEATRWDPSNGRQGVWAVPWG